MVPLLVVVERELRISARIELVATALAAIACRVADVRLATLPPRRAPYTPAPQLRTAARKRATRLSA